MIGLNQDVAEAFSQARFTNARTQTRHQYCALAITYAHMRGMLGAETPQGTVHKQKI